MLEPLGLVVDLGPVEPEGLDEEDLDQPVPPDDVERECSAFRCQRDAPVALRLGEPGLAELADHRGDGALGDTERRGDAGDGRFACRRLRLNQLDRFDIVLDGGSCHAELYERSTGFALGAGSGGGYTQPSLERAMIS